MMERVEIKQKRSHEQWKAPKRAESKHAVAQLEVPKHRMQEKRMSPEQRPRQEEAKKIKSKIKRE